MYLYLPIAELSVNILLLLFLSGGVGFISGLFGVGGGFLLTPLLIFLGIPPAVAVGTSAAQIAASSFSSLLTHAKRKSVDWPLGFVLICGGLVGTVLGIWAFKMLRVAGQLDFVITIGYVSLLSFVGSLMLVESLSALYRTHFKVAPKASKNPAAYAKDGWLHQHFTTSRMTIGLIPLLLLGASIGFLGTILGIGGGFLLIPALIYIFRIPVSIVIGTTFLMILATMLAATLLHSVMSQSVDLMLALVLIIGGVIGAQFGTRLSHILLSQPLRAAIFRLLLALLLLGIGLRFASQILMKPLEPFSIISIEGRR